MFDLCAAYIAVLHRFTSHSFCDLFEALMTVQIFSFAKHYRLRGTENTQNEIPLQYTLNQMQYIEYEKLHYPEYLPRY